MKEKSNYISFFLCLPLILIMTVSCGQNKTEWKGIVEEIDGVTVVKNPKDPLHGEDVFYLEEELSIGKAEGEGEYIFSRINHINVDDEGNIYAVDASASHIRVFDKKGEYLRTIGRKGQGPGEMQRPVFVQITSQNEVLVYDFSARRLIFFSLGGKYLKQKSTARPILPIKLDSYGNLIGIFAPAPPPVGGKELKKYDSNLELLMTIAKEEKGKRGVFEIVKPSLCYDVSPNDNIVWGNSKEYVLRILNPEGRLIKKITKKHDPLKITAKDKEMYKKRYSEPLKIGYKLNFHDYFPAFSDISVDDKERIFVKTYERAEGNQESYYFDVFDSKGIYIAKVPIKANLNRNSVWKRSKLYTIEENEEGFQIVKRHKVS
jgi:hypothetical protein